MVGEMQETLFLVVGAGIAGASAAYELAAHGPVVVVERESQPGYHTTGRSAAVFTELYGNEAIRRLTRGSRQFFADPPAGFSEYPLWTPRNSMMIGRADQTAELDAVYQQNVSILSSLRRLDGRDARRCHPALRADYVAGAVFEPGANDLDVDNLHRGFLRGAKARGAVLVCDAEIRSVERVGARWRVETNVGRLQAEVLVDAAGAWADEFAMMAGAAPVGLVPKRRTAFLFTPSPAAVVDEWPIVIDVDEQFYFKPDSGKLLGSPADETPSPPCDAQPEEIDVAIACDRIQRAATFEVPRIDHKWAGLRTFAPDKTPVVGYDDGVESFFWIAGQGGYGIQTSPAMGRLAASLATGHGVPSDLSALGITEEVLSPCRLRQVDDLHRAATTG